MTRPTSVFHVFPLVLSLMALPLAARAEIYVLDPGHTRVEYRVNHLGFSDMPGIFSNVKGKLDFNPGKPEEASIEATIDASAVTMNHALLDSKIKGPSFFNIAKFPVITFKSTSIDRTGSDKGVVEGKLTFLGVTRLVKLDVQFSKKAWDRYAGAEAVGFTAWTKIHRSDFGMKYLLPDVSDDVSIRIDVEALKAKPSDLVDKAAEVKVIDTTAAKDDGKKVPPSTVAPNDNGKDLADREAEMAKEDSMEGEQPQPGLETPSVPPASARPPSPFPPRPSSPAPKKPRMGSF